MKKKLSFIIATAVFSAAFCTAAFAGTRTLSNGSSGDDVYDLQLVLADYGYFYDEPTGYFGDMTEAALIDFQYDHGLEADGIAGAGTLGYLGLYYDDGEDYQDYSEDYYISETLYPGMSGSDVYALQELLVAYGYLFSDPTGFFGEATQDAVISFQYDYGLEADGIVGPGTIAALTGSSEGSSSYYSYSDDYVSAILNAVYSTPATGSGYCAAWVTQVLQNAGVLTYNINNLRSSYYSYAVVSGLTDSGSTGFNANDYWAYVCYSSDPDELAPGMVIATRNSFTYLGRQYGHVGIYIGDGLVVSSIGYIETLSLDEWNSRYNNTAIGSTIAWGYLPA